MRTGQAPRIRIVPRQETSGLEPGLRQAALEEARTRPLRLERITPLAKLPLAVVLSPAWKGLGSLPLRRIERRQLAFGIATTVRSRGRIPGELHHEAARLNRAERLLAFLGRPRADPRQLSLEFMGSMPAFLARDWTECLGAPAIRSRAVARLLTVAVSRIITMGEHQRAA